MRSTFLCATFASVAFIKKGRRAATTEQEGLALQPTPAARARPPGKARKTASKKGARRLVDDEAAADDADGWTDKTVELD